MTGAMLATRDHGTGKPYTDAQRRRRVGPPRGPEECREEGDSEKWTAIGGKCHVLGFIAHILVR